MRLNEILNSNNQIVLVEGRDDINELILEMYALSEAKWWDRTKAAGRGAKAAAGAAATGANKIIGFVKKAAKKLQDTQPVMNFDTKVDKVLSNWKQQLGDDSKAVKFAQKLGEIGREHPKKTAFVIGVLSGLTSVLGTPGAGMAIGAGLRAAIGLAKGERASTAIGKAAAVGGIGAIAGAVVGQVVDALAGAGNATIDIVRNVAHPVGHGFIKVDQLTTINGHPFHFSGLISSETWEKLETLRSRIPMIGEPGYAKLEGQYLSFMDTMFNNAEVQSDIARRAMEHGAEINKRDVMKGTVSKIAEIVKAIGGGAAGGVGGAKAEGQSNKVVEKVDRIAKGMTAQEIAYVVSQIQRNVPQTR